MGDAIRAVSYKRLWKLLVDKEMSKSDFADIVEYVPETEIWDLYNENREPLGRDHVSGEQLPIDGYHLVVYAIREAKEEVGVDLEPGNGQVVMAYFAKGTSADIQFLGETRKKSL